LAAKHTTVSKVSVYDEAYASERVPPSGGASACELPIGRSFSDNSARASARPSRKLGRVSPLDVLGSVWVHSWVHPEG
jgi:hypothetical protein